MKAWLRENYSRRSVAQTADLLHELFGLAVTVPQVRAANKNHGFGRALKSTPRLYRDEEIAFLREHLRTASYRAVRNAFEHRFGRRLSKPALSYIVRKYGLYGAPNTGRFRPGDRPATAGTVGVVKANRTWFKPGHKINAEAPLWSERWRRNKLKRPILMMKVPERCPHTGRADRWVRKAVWVWQQAHGLVPPGHVVWQRDGDPANCEPGNLELVPKRVMIALNHRTAPAYAGPEANPARMALARLKVASTDAENRRRK